MTRLYLIRHAKPAATWSEATDPGLDTTGELQARGAAQHLAGQASCALPIYTSPLLRCRQTAAPLEHLWQRRAELLTAVAEIPAPPVTERHVWLQQAMAGTWTQLQQRVQSSWPDYARWRKAMIERVTALHEDSVIFSHFIAINVLVGAATDDDAVVCFRPDHASVTVLAVTDGELQVVELGKQADTLVLVRS
jgi:broad specificity phosphatase PhoE